MNDYALELSDLVKDFNGKLAVDHISMTMKKGEILGLVGPNGAGKTTTMRMIMNIIAPDSGEIRILGQHLTEKMKNRIGFLPEERGLYRKMTLNDTLLFLGELKGMKRAQIREKGKAFLQRFDLIGYENKKVEELSKGMAQKFQFITTVIHSPEIIILDEPFSGLDPINIELFKDIILEKKSEGVSIILSTHLMEYAEMIVDSVVMIHKGKKVLDGRISDIKANYGKNFVKIDYEGNAQFVASLPYVKSVRDFGREMEIELADKKDKDRLLQDIVPKLSLFSFHLSEPSLQHIFIQNVREGEDQ